MYIGVQFKDKEKIFKGKIYDFELCEEEEIPEEGQIVRLLDEDYNWLFYTTRVKVVDVKPTVSLNAELQKVRYIKASLDED